VDGKAGQQNGGDQEADCLGGPKDAQSPLVLDSLLAELDTGTNLEPADRGVTESSQLLAS
jgi:hypothetical protein